MTTPRVTVPVDEQVIKRLQEEADHPGLGDSAMVFGPDLRALLRAYRSLSAAPAPEGGAVSSALREMLALVLLKYGNTDEAVNAAVERAQAALATREEAPARAVECVEAMAERFCEVFWDDGEPDSATWPYRNEEQREKWRAVARAALRAQPPAREDAQAVARAHVRLEDDGLFADLEVLNGERLQVEHSPVDLFLHPAPDALREANLWWNAEDWEQTFNSLEDAYDAATGGEMRGVAKLGRATEHDPVWALRIDFDTTGDGETDDYEIRIFKSVEDAYAALAALQAEQKGGAS